MRRHRVIRARNRLFYAIGLVVNALFAAAAALNPNTWRKR